VAVAQRPRDGLDQVRRRVEPEGDRVADVQVPDAGAGGLDPLRLTRQLFGLMAAVLEKEGAQ